MGLLKTTRYRKKLVYDGAEYVSLEEAHMKTVFATVFLLLAFLFCSADGIGQVTPPPTPKPVLYFIGQEPYSTGASSFVRYRYGVFNSSDFPDELFAAAPKLPPCGSNTNAARSWVDLFETNGRRLYGFCAMRKSIDLNTIWFSLPEGTVPPSWIYIEITDRQTGTKYRSNLAETTN